MKNRVLITSVLLLSVIGVNRVFAQKYENNRYGLTLEKKENGYVLKDAKTIERLEVFDIEKAPADMFVPYKHKMRKLKSEDFNQCTTLHYVFKEYPNHKLVIEVDLPKNNKDKKIPYMVWIHGGGWHGGDCMGHKGISTYLASHGIAGIRVSYSFPSDASNFKDSYQDLKDALKFIHKHAKEWNLDEKNFGFGGHSAGGHLSSYMAMMTKGTKFLVAFNGIYDIEHVKPGFVPGKDFTYFGTTDSQRADASPVNKVPKNPPYVILTYSGGDYLVDQDQMLRFEKALKVRNARVETHYKNYYSHAGFIGGSDIYEDMMIYVLKKAQEILQ